MAMVMTQRIQSDFETNPNASMMLSKAEEKNSRRTNRGAAVCPERRTGEAGLTKSRSGHQQPMESTPDAAREASIGGTEMILPETSGGLSSRLRPPQNVEAKRGWRSRGNRKRGGRKRYEGQRGGDRRLGKAPPVTGATKRKGETRGEVICGRKS
ncbi:hypothetical protein YC2023_044944 [Brassica napus]